MTDKEKNVQVGDLVVYNIDKLLLRRVASTPHDAEGLRRRWQEWIKHTKHYLFVVVGHEPKANKRVRLMCLTNDEKSIIIEKTAVLSVVTMDNKQYLLTEQLIEH